MQDETSGQIVALCIRGGKISEQTLKQAVMKALAEMEKTNFHSIKMAGGKQSMKKLRKQGRELSSIEVTDGNIRSFEKCARKYSVDYCLKKDRSADRPRYFVFFKANDMDAMTAAFKEYAGKQAGKEKRESLRGKLDRAIGRAEKHRERDREKEKTREESR